MRHLNTIFPKVIPYETCHKHYAKYQKWKVKQHKGHHQTNDCVLWFYGDNNDTSYNWIDMYRWELLKTYYTMRWSTVSSLLYYTTPFSTWLQHDTLHAIINSYAKIQKTQTTLWEKGISFSQSFFSQISSLSFWQKQKIITHLAQSWYLTRQYRVVRRSCHNQCVVSPHDVIIKEEPTKAYHIKCFMEGKRHTITVTCKNLRHYFGAVGVLVHPGDKRYKAFWWKKIMLPIANKAIPVICDEKANIMDWPGVRFIIPCHNQDDLLLAYKHNLPTDLPSYDSFHHFTTQAKDYVGKDADMFLENVETFLRDISNLDSIEDISHQQGYNIHTGEKLILRATHQRYISTPENAPYSQCTITWYGAQTLQEDNHARCISHTLSNSPKIFLHDNPHIHPTLDSYIEFCIESMNRYGPVYTLFFLCYLQGWINETFSLIDWLSLFPHTLMKYNIQHMLDTIKTYCTSTEAKEWWNHLYEITTTLIQWSDCSEDILALLDECPAIHHEIDDIFRISLRTKNATPYRIPDTMFFSLDAWFDVVLSVINDINSFHHIRHGGNLRLHIVFRPEILIFLRMILVCLSSFKHELTCILYEPTPILHHRSCSNIPERIWLLIHAPADRVDHKLHQIRNACRLCRQKNIPIILKSDESSLQDEDIRILNLLDENFAALHYSINTLSLDQTISILFESMVSAWAWVYLPIKYHGKTELTHTDRTGIWLSLWRIFSILKLFAPSLVYMMCGFFGISTESINQQPPITHKISSIFAKLGRWLCAAVVGYQRENNKQKKPQTVIFQGPQELFDTRSMGMKRIGLHHLTIVQGHKPSTYVREHNVIDTYIWIANQEADTITPRIVDTAKDNLNKIQTKIAKIRAILPKISPHEKLMKQKYEEELLTLKSEEERLQTLLRKEKYLQDSL